MSVKEKLDLYKGLSRSDYFKKNQELSKVLWDSQRIPTVGDIAESITGVENDNVNRIFDFFNNEQAFLQMVERTSDSYDQDESSAFIRKVMSANNEEISAAGYFYKLLMASADDISLADIWCESVGTEFQLSEIDEESFVYFIKNMYVEEFEEIFNGDYSEFLEKMQLLGCTSVVFHSPVSCDFAPLRKICSKCVGLIPQGTRNIGTFTTLMVTETATQAALSSMNKDSGENVNRILQMKYEGKSTVDDITDWVYQVVCTLKNKDVQARWYEIAMLSRMHVDQKTKKPFIIGFKGSINLSENDFGSYIFSATFKNFERVVRRGEFDDTSLKLQIAMNMYDDQK